jgi:hypothetical protein
MSLSLLAAEVGDVDEGNHRSFNDILQGSVGSDTHLEPRSIMGLYFGVSGDQIAQHGLDILNQMIIANQIGDDVADRTADIALDQVDTVDAIKNKVENAASSLDYVSITMVIKNENRQLQP